MKAIVLTYDKYHPIADHMMHCYSEIWPEHPFVFRVPYQEFPQQLKDKYGEDIELIKTSSDIVSTMKTLLQDIDDDEWIYWCMDDHYPVELNIDQINSIYNWVNELYDKEVASVLFTYEMSDLQYSVNSIMTKKQVIKDMGNRRYYRLSNFRGIWFHQFMRAKILKYFFESFPDDLTVAKDMDYYKDNLSLPHNFKRFVCSKRFAVIGESANRGKITTNCAKSMKKYNIKIPENFEILDREIFRCSKKYEKPYWYYISRNMYYAMRKKLRLTI